MMAVDNRSINHNQQNGGIALLRVWMCYEVIISHFLNFRHGGAITDFLVGFEGIAVPVFIMLSFLLVGRKLSSVKSGGWTRQRLCRLLIPHVAWAFIYYICYRITNRLQITSIQLERSDLIWQLLLGSNPSLNRVMWFQFAILIATLLCLVIYRVLPYKWANYALAVLGIAMITSQYSGLNVRMFSSMRWELYWSLGRLAEVIPVAVVGCLLSQIDYLTVIYNHRRLILGLCIIALICSECLVPYSEIDGFGYAGIHCIVEAFCIISIFAALRIPSSPIVSIATRCTLGIYCIHFMLNTYLSILYEHINVETGTLLYCVVIYISGYGLSAMLAIHPWTRMLVE